jgi:hypothetical protein
MDSKLAMRTFVEPLSDALGLGVPESCFPKSTDIIWKNLIRGTLFSSPPVTNPSLPTAFNRLCVKPLEGPGGHWAMWLLCLFTHWPVADACSVRKTKNRALIDVFWGQKALTAANPR